jgi:hypothetical protein
MPCAVLLGAHFRRRAGGVRNAFGCALVVRGKAYALMAIVEDRIILAIGLLDLIQRLGDEKAFQAIARHEGEHALDTRIRMGLFEAIAFWRSSPRGRGVTPRRAKPTLY